MPRLGNDMVHSPTSPDLSPISTTSALLTPTDLSPAKQFDQKLPPTFDFNGGLRHIDSSNSLLFETGYRLQDAVPHGSQGFWSSSPSLSPDSGYFPSFEPFTDAPHAAVARGQPLFASQSQLERRRLDSNVLPPSLPPLTWGGQRYRTTSEWLKADDVAERGLQFTTDSAFRSSQGPQASPPARQGSQGHEVSGHTTSSHSVVLNGHHSLSTSCRSCIPHQLPLTISSSVASSSRLTNKHRSFCSRS